MMRFDWRLIENYRISTQFLGFLLVESGFPFQAHSNRGWSGSLLGEARTKLKVEDPVMRESIWNYKKRQMLFGSMTKNKNLVTKPYFDCTTPTRDIVYRYYARKEMSLFYYSTFRIAGNMLGWTKGVYQNSAMGI